jgi:Primase C terminal 2 (PriCT-2)
LRCVALARRRPATALTKIDAAALDARHEQQSSRQQQTEINQMAKHDASRPNGGDKAPSIDGNIARRFLDLLDPDHDTFLFAAGDDNRERVKQARKTKSPVWVDHRHGSLDAQLAWLNQQQAQGWGIFICVQRMKGKRRLAKYVDIIRAIFHEWDTAAPPPAFELPPSLIIETSASVDANGEIFPKLHSYWFVDHEHPISAEDFGGLMKCMVETHGSDPDAKDLARVLRLPGTWHQKGQPHQVKIVGGCEARYSRDELIKAFPPPMRHEPEPKARPTYTGPMPGLERFDTPMKFIAADDYHKALTVGMALHHEGGGSGQARAQWEAWCGTSSAKYEDGWCESKWKSFNGHGITGGTIFKLAKEGGYVKPDRDDKEDKASKEPPKGKKATNGTNGQDHGHATSVKANGVAKPNHELPIVLIHAGKLSEMATEAEGHLIKADVQFYQRNSKLVRPIIENVSAADRRKTTTVALAPVSEAYMRDQLGRTIKWEKYVRREKDYVPADAPKDVGEIILARSGEWGFNPINGIITTQTLRPDGTILQTPGYDPDTRLILIDPPALPAMPERPTREDALAALDLLNDLLVEFPFADAASRSVGLSTLMTPVVRGAMSVAPMHVARAPTAGSGKSYLFDVAAAIAAGQPCHVIAAGRTEEETEKRLGACVLSGYPLVSIDNVNGELGGDFLCQVIERPIVSPRILGRSENPSLVNRTTWFATGNNIRLVGDLTRRALIASLDAKLERPELRSFKADPVQQVLADRGQYVAAALTVSRAYIVAGQPNKLPRLASFDAWSDIVRSALVWLGQADPVDTVAVARAEDPDLQNLTTLLEAWREEIGTGEDKPCTASQLLAKVQDKNFHYGDDSRPIYSDEPRYPALREAIEGLGLSKDSAKSLGKWLSAHKGRMVDQCCFATLAAEGNRKGGLQWYVQKT